MDTTRASLLTRIRDRSDTGAWGEFDRLYRPIVYRFALNVGLSPSDADDISQHCIIIVAQRIDEFIYDSAKGRFRNWLFTVARNHIRRTRRDGARCLTGTVDLEAFESGHPSPEVLFEKIWLQEHLRYCLDQLRGEILPAAFQAYSDHVFGEASVEVVCRAHGLDRNQFYKLKHTLTNKLIRKMKHILRFC